MTGGCSSCPWREGSPPLSSALGLGRVRPRRAEGLRRKRCFWRRMERRGPELRGCWQPLRLFVCPSFTHWSQSVCQLPAALTVVPLSSGLELRCVGVWSLSRAAMAPTGPLPLLLPPHPSAGSWLNQPMRRGHTLEGRVSGGEGTGRPPSEESFLHHHLQSGGLSAPPPRVQSQHYITQSSTLHLLNKLWSLRGAPLSSDQPISRSRS